MAMALSVAAAVSAAAIFNSILSIPDNVLSRFRFQKQPQPPGGFLLPYSRRRPPLHPPAFLPPSAPSRRPLPFLPARRAGPSPSAAGSSSLPVRRRARQQPRRQPRSAPGAAPPAASAPGGCRAADRDLAWPLPLRRPLGRHCCSRRRPSTRSARARCAPRAPACAPSLRTTLPGSCPTLVVARPAALRCCSAALLRPHPIDAPTAATTAAGPNVGVTTGPGTHAPAVLSSELAHGGAPYIAGLGPIHSASPLPMRRGSPPGFPAFATTWSHTVAPSALPTTDSSLVGTLATIQAAVTASRERERAASLALERERALGAALTTQMASTQRLLARPTLADAAPQRNPTPLTSTPTSSPLSTLKPPSRGSRPLAKMTVGRGLTGQSDGF
eukprot:XP_020406462.1 nascent polypeptide-associated complex subunit alpha, muscle-specific form-like [Zea mays]